MKKIFLILTLSTAVLNAKSQDTLVSAFFGLDNGLPSLLCNQLGSQLDGMPVNFKFPLDASSLSETDFEVLDSLGNIHTPICAFLAPANENGENRTVLLLGEFGTAVTNPPVEVRVVGDLFTTDTLSGESGEWEYREYISYMPQIADFPPNLTIIELIEMIKTIRCNIINEQELIDLFGLKSFLHKKFSTLSGGTKQKVNIILTFMSNSPLIILDEPTTGLDPLALITFKKLLLKEKEKGKTIIITSHIISLIEEISDEIVFILDGKIFFNGSISTLKKKTKKNNLEHAIANIIQNHND